MRMDDDDKWPHFFRSNPNDKANYFFRVFADIAETQKPKWIGVDWAVGSGMNRGDIVSRESNVVHVRFKDAVIE